MKKILLAAGAVLALGACTTMPTGPSVMVLPGTGKNFDQFKMDDYECRQYASHQVGGSSPDGAAESSGVKSAVVGTAVGAAAGALIGGRHGAATGAGVGLIAGSATGAGAAGASQRTLQQRYDAGFTQCMYAKGHRVPVAGRFENAPRGSSYTAPPPPPPGTPPPPPPGTR